MKLQTNYPCIIVSPLSNPLSPYSLPTSFPYVRIRLRMYLKHYTASDYALFSLLFILLIHVTPSI